MLNRPPVIFFIGVQGSGKNYHGEAISKREELKNKTIFYDGDDALPREMKQQVDNGSGLTPGQANNYITNYLIPALIDKRKEATEQGKILIVAQALYFNSHRLSIVNELGGDIYFIVVNPSFALQVKQINSRCVAREKPFFIAFKEILIGGAISNFFFQTPAKSLKAFTIPNLGKGYDEEFFNAFKKTPCYSAITQLGEESKQESSESFDKSSMARMLSGLSKSEQSQAKVEERQIVSDSSKNWNAYILAGSVLLCAGIAGYAFFARRRGGFTPEAIAEMLCANAFKLQA